MYTNRFYQYRRAMVRGLVKTLPLILAIAMFISPFTALTTSNAVQAAAPTVASNCQLNSAHGNIQHVIEIQFDNVHFRRDNPNVPSDLEQMPHLLNFIKNNGTLLTNHHTPLISHTANDIITTLTGVYPDKHGIPVANSFRYFLTNGTTASSASFGYWTDQVSTTDTTPLMIDQAGKIAPAPWVPYTRAGCNVGAVATANIVLENSNTSPTGDIAKIFGNPSPEFTEVQTDLASSNPQVKAQPQADFVGIAIHCATGAALCSAANNGKADVLPDEPGGYNGFNGLFGAKYVDPQISPSGPLTDLSGNTIQDPTGNPGFPGFDGMSASVSLAFVAAMQEHGVPITYAYISDAHDAHPSGPAYGPGEAGYVATLKAYDDAWAAFFTRLANDGINSSNTLFVFTSDENDHFVGGTPTSPCDGVNTPCTYSHVNCPSVTVPTCPSDNVGELNVNMAGLLATEQNITTTFTVHSDDAPVVYINGRPASNDPVTRTFERATSVLTATNYYKGVTQNMTIAMADPVELKLLHMITSDPARTPTFTWFANPDYFIFAGAQNCNSPCVQEQFGFAWNHGDVTPDITTTWLGLVGPGIRHQGIDSRTWSDHTDIRPTILMLIGLKDDYAHDGRALFEEVEEWALPQSVRVHREALIALAQVYKQINAPVGALGLATLGVSTFALESNSPSDQTYTALENQLATLTTQRDAIAAQMAAMLEGATFGHHPISEQQLRQFMSRGQQLRNQGERMARQSH